MIVYVDEAPHDNREDYSYGWNEKGQRFHALKSGRRQGRVNMIAAQCLGQLMAPFTVEGSCNRTVFEILSDAGSGLKVVFANNSTSLIVYAMLWSMFYTYRPNRPGGYYKI